jgi:hypothetical protein
VKFGTHAARVIGNPQHPGVRAVEHERTRAFGMHGRVQSGHGTALRDAGHVGPLGPAGVHDGPEVLDVLLESGGVRYRVGEARAPLVERDDPPERRESIVEVREGRFLPPDLQVRDPAWGDHEIRAVAVSRVGDAQVAALRVASLGRRDHSPPRLRRHSGRSEPSRDPGRDKQIRQPHSRPAGAHRLPAAGGRRSPDSDTERRQVARQLTRAPGRTAARTATPCDRPAASLQDRFRNKV